MRSFWRTYNLIWIIGTAGMGVAFIVAGFAIPVAAFGMWIGGACCLLTAGALLAWHIFSKDLIPDMPMANPFEAMSQVSQMNAYAAGLSGAAPVGGAMGATITDTRQQWIPGTARIDQITETGFSGPNGRVVDLRLTVWLPGRNPYEILVRETVQPAAEAYVTQGATVHVSADAANSQDVRLQLPR